MDDPIAPVLAALQEGAFDRAEALIAELIAAAKAAPALLHLAGQIALQTGNTAEACARMQRARAGDAGNPQFANDLGVALRYAGRPQEAVLEFAAAVALAESYQQAWHNLGMTRRALGDLAGADQALMRAAALAPDPASHIALGAVRLARGDAAGADSVLARAGELAPEAVEPLMYRALALHRLDRAAEADAAIARALQLRPDAAPAHNIKGMIAAERGDDAGALAAFAEAVRLAPDDAALRANLGAAQARREDPQAAATLEAALARAPDNADALYALGIVRHRAGEWAEARRLLERAPDHALAAAALLMDAQYDEAETGESLCAAARAWGERFAWQAGAYRDWPNAREPERRLRVGFVSPDFRDHSCAFFLEPLFAALDRTQVEVFAYAELRRQDAVTERFRRLADRFVLTRGMSDAALAARVRADAIDVLIDCAGHSADNRLAMFALHPAPVQATWLGYPGTAGVKAIGWRISDAICDPPAEAHTTETLLRLPDALLCYAPPDDAPPVAARPTGPVVFGSFNNARKLSPGTLAAWARILRELPEATLLLKAKDMAKPPVERSIRAAFAGIDPARVTLIDWIDDPAGHLAAYGRIDVALDPFPYAGTTTTCEALWMGVPVVTLAGARHAARVGASLLRCLGLAELVARDVDDYVAHAAALARNAARRAELRSGLRARMLASPLTDRDGFARGFAVALRRIWRAWCDGP
jgi:predicted O-linked N-acetylglucosamine transferase (SPINDLY family)